LGEKPGGWGKKRLKVQGGKTNLRGEGEEKNKTRGGPPQP